MRTAAGCVLVAVAACGSPPKPPPIAPLPPPEAKVEIAPGTCPAPDAAEPRIRAVLVAHHAEHGDFTIRVTVTAATAPAPTNLTLSIVRPTGEVGVERDYALGPADCASAPDLLALAVDRFLSSFPEWAGPAPAPPPPPPPPPRWLEVAAASAINAMFLPVGADAHIEAIVDYGGARDRFGLTALVRAGVPQSAGDGAFQQTAVLGGIAWRRRLGAWTLRVEARAGAVRVTGTGFLQNDFDWLPWVEGAVFAGRALSWGALGVELAATGLRDHARTRDGLVSEDIPLLRIGLSAEIGLVSRR